MAARQTGRQSGSALKSRKITNRSILLQENEDKGEQSSVPPCSKPFTTSVQFKMNVGKKKQRERERAVWEIVREIKTVLGKL
jgi:hypothetical protein